MTKYYIYEKENPKIIIRETYIKKEAERYRKQGHFIRSRTKK